MQWEVSINLCNHWSGYNLSLGLYCEKILFLWIPLSVFSFDFRDVNVLECLNELLLVIHFFTEFEPPPPPCLHSLDVILSKFLLWKVGSCTLLFGLVLRSHETWSCGLIQTFGLPVYAYLANTYKHRRHSCSIHSVFQNGPVCPVYTFSHSHEYNWPLTLLVVKSSFADRKHLCLAMFSAWCSECSPT
jgi:hypothetical protein